MSPCSFPIVDLMNLTPTEPSMELRALLRKHTKHVLAVYKHILSSIFIVTTQASTRGLKDFNTINRAAFFSMSFLFQIQDLVTQRVWSVRHAKDMQRCSTLNFQNICQNLDPILKLRRRRVWVRTRASP